MRAVAMASTLAYEKACRKGDERQQMYYAGFLHCWGLVTELEQPRPDTIHVVAAMKELGFPDAVCNAVIGLLEG